MNLTLESFRLLVINLAASLGAGFSAVPILVLSVTVALPSLSLAGVIRGRVFERESHAPVPGANVKIEAAGSVHRTATGRDGSYLMGNLSPGEYTVTVTAVGYVTATAAGLALEEGDTLFANLPLAVDLVNLDAVVVSASRTDEKSIDAPASVSVIDQKEISVQPSVVATEHLRGIAGVDIAQTGVSQQTVVVRGFSNVASTSLMMMTDNRIAGVPSLRINVPSFMPLTNDDIDRMELVRGPGSALYGPNASNGVLNIITQSPFAYQGTNLSVAGGNQSLFQGTFRQSGLISDMVGYKISGQYFRANDWEFVDTVETQARADAIANGANPDTLRIGLRDPVVERVGAEGRIDARVGGDAIVNATVGFNQSIRSIELTDIGAAQAKDWSYFYAQSRLTWGDLFVQAYLNASNAGQSYVLRTGQALVDRSKQFVAQVQHAHAFGDNERLTYGADLLLTRPVTDGTINGRNENDDDINEYGAFLQSETKLVPDRLNLILTGRIDKHNRLDDPFFSPRAAVLYTPWESQSFRLTFNRAFQTPATSEQFLDIVAIHNVFGFPEPYTVDVRASGVPKGGLYFARDANGRPYFYSQFSADRSIPIPVDAAAPDMWSTIIQILRYFGKDISQVPAPAAADIHSLMANLNEATRSFDPVDGPHDVPGLRPTVTQTLEGGYKGVLGKKFETDVALYYSKINDFIGQFQVVTPNVFLNQSQTKSWLQQHGLSDSEATVCAALIARIPLGTVSPENVIDPTAVIVAPRNFGTIEIFGIDYSLAYHVDDDWTVEGSYSFVNKNYFENLDGVADLALNAPIHKGALSLRYFDAPSGLSAEVRTRWMGGFRMNSGVYYGNVDPYTLIDVTAGSRIPGYQHFALTLSVANLLDHRHYEFIGAPEIGLLMMGRVAYTL